MTRIPAAPISVWRPTRLASFLRGAPHYPEHVEESFWARDADRLAAAGANTVRMGEFAWHLWEPHEGRFDFDLFDRAIDILGARGISTILCTPTATPPRWLTRDYPEVLRVDANGRPTQHGSRQHADTTSPVFRAHSRRITQALATHYRENALVVGWQTDNELNNTVSESYSPSCRLAFQGWLRQRYDNDIAAVNRAWGGNFWALAYDSFADIELPRPFAPTFPAPGHQLDFHRFLADATARFQADQIAILRATNPDWFVFHDLGGLSDMDFRGSFGRDVDFLGFNVYPLLYDEMERKGSPALSQAWRLDLARAYTGNFIVPEQTTGLGSQAAYSTLNPEPGEMRRMALSSVARGADGVMFFRWRPAHFGAEIYWMGVIDHDDVPRRRYDEASQFFHEMARIEPQLLGTHVRMDIGIAGADFDAEEAHKTYPMGLPSPQEEARVLHAACYARNIACGLIHPEDDLSPLKVLYVPHWVIWKPEWTAAVTDFVTAGGTLVLSALTATRSAENQILHSLAPNAGLADLAGVQVEEFGRLAGPGASGLFAPMTAAFPGAYVDAAPQAAASASRAYAMRLGNRQLRAAHLYETLILAPGTETLGSWADCWLSDRPCVTRRPVGAGQVIYVATYLTPELAEVLIETVIEPAGAVPILRDLPPGVEVTMRSAKGRSLCFLLNTTSHPVTIPQAPAGHDLLADRPQKAGSMELPAYGCVVIRLAGSDPGA